MSGDDAIVYHFLDDSIDFKSFTIQERIREEEARKCHNGSVNGQGWCPVVWDAILCWPSKPPGELAIQSCPGYILGFISKANATRQCMSNGEWFRRNETNETWSDYSECSESQYVTILTDIPGVELNNVTLIKKWLPVIMTISKIGYSVSLSTLIVAFFILATIKKLRCQRNMLHLHLFASFIMRALMAVLKDILFVSGIGRPSHILEKNGESFLLANEVGNNWHCKAFTSFWQYFILANYSWILMEGLYLHNLVFHALRMDATCSIAPYIIMGWGLPAIFIVCWVITRVMLENTLCWTISNNSYLFLLIRIPTMLSILINFGLFISIIRLLLSKIKSTVCEETERYKRFARSTLVLVPLFGVHYTLFLGMSFGIDVSEFVELIWLFCDQLFASFQGFFVAVLYCFINGEVKAEVSAIIKSNNWSYEWCGDWGLKRSTRSNSTCNCNTNKLSKHRSKKSQWNRHNCICCHFLYEEEGRMAHSMTSEISACGAMNHEKVREQHRWNESECCNLAFELHNLQQHS